MKMLMNWLNTNKTKKIGTPPRHLEALRHVLQARIELLRGNREVPDYHKETDDLLAKAEERLSRIRP